jgi:flagellin
MRELAVQSANGTYKDEVDRENIAKEVVALKSEMDRIASSTHYNGIKLLNGTMGGDKLEFDGTNFTIDGATVGLPGIGANSIDGFTINAGVGGQALAAAINDYGIDAEATLSVKYFDGASVPTVSLQIGDKSYTTKLSPDAGDSAITLYDADGNSVGTIVGVSAAQLIAAAKTSVNDAVASGLKMNVGGTIAAGGKVTFNGVGDEAMLADRNDKLIFQIGANGHADQRVGLHVDNMSSGQLGGKYGVINNILVDTREHANDAIKVIDAATNQVSGTRADLGALQNRLEHTVNNLGVTRENLQNAESLIRDVDMAKEMMEFTKNNILLQASQAMLAQSNQLPQGVLQLLR